MIIPYGSLSIAIIVFLLSSKSDNFFFKGLTNCLRRLFFIKTSCVFFSCSVSLFSGQTFFLLKFTFFNATFVIPLSFFLLSSSKSHVKAYVFAQNAQKQSMSSNCGASFLDLPQTFLYVSL